MAKFIALRVDERLFRLLFQRRQNTGTATQEFIRRCVRSGLRAELSKPPKTGPIEAEEGLVSLDLADLGEELFALKPELPETSRGQFEAVSALHEVNKMLCKILRGEKYGQQIHLPKSQEVQLAVLLGDIEVIDDDNAAPPLQTHQPKGWRIETSGLANDKFIIAYHDGSGGIMRYEQPPAPTREHYFDEEEQVDAYRLVPSTCPAEIIQQFLLLTGDCPDPLTRQNREAAAGERMRRELAEKEWQRKQQNSCGIALR